MSTCLAPLTARYKLESRFNEWMLFHGTDQVAAKAVCGTGFATFFAGVNTGTLYGDGTYFAASSTMVDEYAKVDREGLFYTLLCRVAGGHVMYNDRTTPDAEKLFKAVVSGENDSVLGDREKGRNMFREFVIYDTDQCYAEYILWYRRMHGERRTRSAPAPDAPAAPLMYPAAALPLAPAPDAPAAPLMYPAAAAPATLAPNVQAAPLTDASAPLTDAVAAAPATPMRDVPAAPLTDAVATVPAALAPDAPAALLTEAVAAAPATLTPDVPAAPLTDEIATVPAALAPDAPAALLSDATAASPAALAIDVRAAQLTNVVAGAPATLTPGVQAAPLKDASQSFCLLH